MDNKNKTVFITGGSDGIGLATVKLLAQERFNVFSFSINSPAKEQKNDLEKNFSVEFFEGDIKKENQVKKGIKKAIKKFGGIDFLINNAGLAQNKEFLLTDQKDWDKIIDVNIKGTLNVTRNALDVMLKQRSGTIINISSGTGIYGVEKLSLYSLTKAALINFSQSLKDEVSKYNISVFTITPGSTATKMFEECFPGQKPHHTPEQVAEVILKSIKGEIIPDQRQIIDVFKHTG